MNILMAASCSSDPNLGVPGVMHSLAAEYRRAGHDVKFLFRDRPGRIGEMLFGIRLAFGAEARWADVVDSHAVEAWPLCERKSGPVVVARSHGLEIVVHRRFLDAARRGKARVSLLYWTYRGSVRLWFERRAIRKSNASFILNAADHAICRNEFGAAPDRLHLLPNGYPAVFLEHPIEAAPSDGVAFVGSWLARKGNDTAVGILTALARSRPSLRLLIAGTGVDAAAVAGDFPPDVRDRLAIRPRFSRAELPQLLRGFGVLLFPSRSEGYPLSLVEAMACGMVPVASSIPGVVDVVRDGENGFLVPEGDPDGFVARIGSVLDDPGAYAALRSAARESVRGTSWENLAGTQLAIYDSLLARRRGQTTESSSSEGVIR